MSVAQYLLGPLLFGFRRKTIRFRTSGSVDYSSFHNTMEHGEGRVWFSSSLYTFLDAFRKVRPSGKIFLRNGFILLAERREMLVVLLENIVGFEDARAAGARIRHGLCCFFCIVTTKMRREMDMGTFLNADDRRNENPLERSFPLLCYEEQSSYGRNLPIVPYGTV